VGLPRRRGLKRSLVIAVLAAMFELPPLDNAVDGFCDTGSFYTNRGDTLS
jgi:hypothetical protein